MFSKCSQEWSLRAGVTFGCPAPAPPSEWGGTCNMLCICPVSWVYAYYTVRMDFRRPLTIVTPTLDGDVLSALARADVEFTGRELAQRTGRGSVAGVRRVADRLVEEGIVLRRVAGRSHLYRLNREHVAAQWIEGLATLPEQVIDQLRAIIADWEQAPSLAFLFGSVAKRQASPESDLDVLVVRQLGCDPESDRWRTQLIALQQKATGLTGNDARVLEVGEEELCVGMAEPVFDDVLREGIALLGTKRKLRRLLDSRSEGGRSHATL